MIRICEEKEYNVLIGILRMSFESASMDKIIEDKLGNAVGMSWWERKSLDVRREIRANPKGVFVKIVNNHITGFVTTFIEAESKTGRIMTLTVHPDFQKKGIGSELINHALNYFKEMGLKIARIETLEDNAGALNLYRKLEFEDMARQVYLAKKIN